MAIRFHARGNVAVVELDNPPGNELSCAMRRGLGEALDRVEDDPAFAALVISGAGKLFSSGDDIPEAGQPRARQEPSLASLLRQIETMNKPVIAALHGACVGAGLELAMGAHFRVAAPGTDIGLPEIKFGLIPGNGGTQRLPRALGVETALDMILAGSTAKSDAIAALPNQKLLDRLIDGDLLDGAVAFAATCASHADRTSRLPLLRDLEAVHADADVFFQSARNRVGAGSGTLPAPAKCVDAVEASVKRSFDDGVAFERELFRYLLATPASAALRHALLAERAAARVPGIDAATPRIGVRNVAVIGAGTMGGGIAMSFLDAGYPVTLLETSREALDRGVGLVRKNYDAKVRKGRMSQADCDRLMAALRTTLSYGDIADAELVIEAVYEDMGVKESVFRTLDETLRPGAILATNTSTLDVDRIAAVTRRPGDVIGMHFFSPANVMKLLEVIRGKSTRPEVLATAMDLANRIRKTAVVSGVCDGFIGNRMIDQYFRQATFLLEEGCSPEQVDRAIERFGFAMGPFRVADLAGNDIGWAVRKRRRIEKPHVRYSRVGDLVCELGRFGQKTGAGFYDYPEGARAGKPSAVVSDLLTQFRREAGIEAREVDDDEIVHRLVWALVNEGARLLEEGIASKAGDVDVVYLTGYGFPRHRGGPMFYADTVGLYNVVRAMRRFARNPNADPAFWEPAPLLARLAAEGTSFN